MSSPGTTPVLFQLEPGLPLFAPLLQQLQSAPGAAATPRFPDGESYLRAESDVRGRSCLILANLADPDNKFLPPYFLASTLLNSGLRRLITSNSIPHSSNAVDISHVLASAIETLIYRP